MKWSEIKRQTDKAGAIFVRHGKKHDIYKNPKTGDIFLIGRHSSEEVPKGTANDELIKAGIKQN
jgi:predicted RNA binding protein YcfA (HicA-like mRNA interferase family)